MGGALCILSSVLLLVVGAGVLRANADLAGDKQALLDFADNLPHSRYLNWTESSPVCSNWVGVTCDKDGSRVIALRLPGVGFHGPIPANTLGRLSDLQILSLRSNAITGSFPSDFANLKNLSYLYLQSNKFSGPLPWDFSVWKNLTILNLSNNAFNGSIPSSLATLTQLDGLNLASNLLSGEIPDLQLPQLQLLNLSNNNLHGSVPKSLERFPSSVFAGNDLSFPNSTPHPSPVISPPCDLQPRSKTPRMLNGMALLAIVIAGCLLALASVGILIFIRRSKRKGEEMFSGKLPKMRMSPEKAISRSQDANNRLVFFEGCNYAFDLEDLLRASAEVLGKGTFGISYKAILEDAVTVVVKRLKEVSAGKREFEQQMEIVGGIRHENVVELKAYYYSKDEKLMVYDYYSQGSLSTLLHGKLGEDRTPLDWDSRMRIALGAARGIARVHLENNGRLVHGNVKSSNILINPQQYGCVSDLGLAAVMSSLAPPISRAAGYRAPEVTDTRKAGQPSDVYSFGVVLLELLTGKSPVHATGYGEMVHLVRWVHSVVREEWTAEVFDVELMRYPNIEEELVEMLQIAMACVVRMPDQRPKMADVAKMIENVRCLETNNRPSSENRSERSSPLQPAVRSSPAPSQ